MSSAYHKDPFNGPNKLPKTRESQTPSNSGARLSSDFSSPSRDPRPSRPLGDSNSSRRDNFDGGNSERTGRDAEGLFGSRSVFDRPSSNSSNSQQGNRHASSTPSHSTDNKGGVNGAGRRENDRRRTVSNSDFNRSSGASDKPLLYDYFGEADFDSDEEAGSKTRYNPRPNSYGNSVPGSSSSSAPKSSSVPSRLPSNRDSHDRGHRNDNNQGKGDQHRPQNGKQSPPARTFTPSTPKATSSAQTPSSNRTATFEHTSSPTVPSAPQIPPRAAASPASVDSSITAPKVVSSPSISLAPNSSTETIGKTSAPVAPSAVTPSASSAGTPVVVPAVGTNVAQPSAPATPSLPASTPSVAAAPPAVTPKGTPPVSLAKSGNIAPNSLLQPAPSKSVNYLDYVLSKAQPATGTAKSTAPKESSVMGSTTRPPTATISANPAANTGTMRAGTATPKTTSSPLSPISPTATSPAPTGPTATVSTPKSTAPATPVPAPSNAAALPSTPKLPSPAVAAGSPAIASPSPVPPPKNPSPTVTASSLTTASSLPSRIPSTSAKVTAKPAGAVASVPPIAAITSPAATSVSANVPKISAAISPEAKVTSVNLPSSVIAPTASTTKTAAPPTAAPAKITAPPASTATVAAKTPILPPSTTGSPAPPKAASAVPPRTASATSPTESNMTANTVSLSSLESARTIPRVPGPTVHIASRPSPPTSTVTSQENFAAKSPSPLASGSTASSSGSSVNSSTKDRAVSPSNTTQTDSLTDSEIAIFTGAARELLEIQGPPTNLTAYHSKSPRDFARTAIMLSKNIDVATLRKQALAASATLSPSASDSLPTQVRSSQAPSVPKNNTAPPPQQQKNTLQPSVPTPAPVAAPMPNAPASVLPIPIIANMPRSSSPNFGRSSSPVPSVAASLPAVAPAPTTPSTNMFVPQAAPLTSPSLLPLVPTQTSTVAPQQAGSCTMFQRLQNRMESFIATTRRPLAVPTPPKEPQDSPRLVLGDDGRTQRISSVQTAPTSRIAIFGVTGSMFQVLLDTLQPYYPATRITLADPLTATLVLIDPLRPFDWAQYIAILNNILVAYRDWADVVAKHRMPVSLAPYLIPQAKQPTPFTPALLSGFSLLILQHPLLTAQQRQTRQLELAEAESARETGAGRPASSATPSAATAVPSSSSTVGFMDELTQAYISYAIRSLKLPHKFWSSPLESFTLPKERYILVTHEKLSMYGCARKEDGPSTRTEATGNPVQASAAVTTDPEEPMMDCPTDRALRGTLESFASVWTSGELLTYLSTASVPPLRPAAQ